MEDKPENGKKVLLYKKIADEICGQIENGTLKKGMRLPSEAAMSQKQGVAIGTVKKAYADLQGKGYIYKIRGGGAYVSGDMSDGGGGENAPEDVAGQMIQELVQKGFRMNQIYAMVQKQTKQVFDRAQLVKAALVDCNKETLHNVQNDLELIPYLDVKPFLLEELFSGEKVIGSEYRLAVVSQKHYGDFIRYADSIHLRTEEMALRESRETIARLTVIPDWQELCILYRSREFLESVQYTLKCLGKKNKIIAINEEQLTDEVGGYGTEKIPFVIPPDYMEFCNARLLQVVGRARKAGNLIIPFEFEIDKGSLLHLKRVVEEMRGREAELNR